MGHLLYQMGVVNKRAMHKYEQESKKRGKGSFAFAWVLDETEEERYCNLGKMHMITCICLVLACLMNGLNC